MKKVFCLLLVGVLMFGSISANAAVINKVQFDLQGEVVKVEGLIPESANKDVNIMVLKPGVTVSNIPAGQGSLNDYSIYAATGTVGSDGNYLFTFALPTVAGDYNVYIGTQDVKDNLTVYIGSISDMMEAISEFNNAQSTQVAGLIDTYRNLLNLNFSDYDTLKNSGADLSLVYKAVSDATFGSTDVMKLQSIIRNSSTAAFINNQTDKSIIAGRIDNSMNDLFNTTSMAYTYYNNNNFITAGGKNSVASLFIANSKAATYEEFKQALGDNVAVSALNIAENFANWDKSLSDFATDMGQSLTAYNDLGVKKELVFKKVAVNNPYYTKDLFKQAFNTAVNEVANSGGNGGSSGGNGGSTGGSTNVSFTPNTPVIPTTPPKTEGKSKYFKDIDHISWAVESIDKLYEKGIINGKENGIFDGDGLVTREEFVKMIVTAFNFNSQVSENKFADVSSDAWYFNYINTAKNLGVVNGVSENEFGIGSNISRQDMAVMVCNALIKSGKEIKDSEVTFADAQQISDYAKASVAKLASAGIINGVGDNKFAPSGSATRAEAAKIINGILTLVGGGNIE